jgi:hypothetical protein
MPFHQRDNALFTAFAPPDDPQIAVAVVAEHACHGSSGASPIAMAVIKAYLQKYMPEKYSDDAIKARTKKGGVPMPVAVKASVEESEDTVQLPDVPAHKPQPKPIANPNNGDENED